MTCTCTPDQYSQCHKRCDRVAIDADYSGAEHITVPATDGINLIITGAVGSPLQSQLNADAATIKRLMEDNERLTLQKELAEGRNRELSQWNVFNNRRYLLIDNKVFEVILVDVDGDFEADCVSDSIRVLISKNENGYFVANAMDGFGNNIKSHFEKLKVKLINIINK